MAEIAAFIDRDGTISDEVGNILIRPMNGR